MKDSFNDLTFKEIVLKLDNLRQEYRDLRFNLVIGHVDNPLKKRTLKRKIARVITIINEYKSGIRIEKKKIETEKPKEKPKEKAKAIEKPKEKELKEKV